MPAACERRPRSRCSRRPHLPLLPGPLCSASSLSCKGGAYKDHVGCTQCANGLTLSVGEMFYALINIGTSPVSAGSAAAGRMCGSELGGLSCTPSPGNTPLPARCCCC